MSVNARELSENLARVIENMLVASRKMGDETTAMALEKQAATLKKGLVRVALVGNTSSGKSTIINALLERLIVPENPSVCSPVPVWIYYHDGREINVEVVRQREGGKFEAEKTEPDTFMTECCYNVSDISNVERVRFESVFEANIAMENDMLSTGAIMIDTLGIAATEVDTAKTLAVLNEGVDLVVFASKNAQLLQDEAEFLREYVLGRGKRQVTYPLAPENLIFILNWFQNTVRPRDSFINSLTRLFEGTEYMQSLNELNAWAETNVFDVQALFARMLRCGGVYPYTKLAPAGSTEKEKDELIRREKKEEIFLQRCDRTSKDGQGDYGFVALKEGILNHVNRRATGRNSVGFSRIYSLQRILNQIKGSANSRIQDAAVTAADLEVFKQNIEKIENQLNAGNDDLRTALNMLKENYITGFNNIFKEICGPNGSANNSAHGHVRQMVMPDSFSECFNAKDFLAMNGQAQSAFLDNYVDDMLVEVTAICRKLVLRALKEQRSEGPGAALPMEVLEKSRVYVVSQGKSLNSYISSLKALGVKEKLGVMLPEESEVEAIFVSLQTDLEKRLLEAVSDALSRGKDKFNTKRNVYIHNATGGFFNGLLSRINRLLNGTIGDFVGNRIKNHVWESIRDEYLDPLVDNCLAALGSFNEPDVKGGLYDAVSDAYVEVMMSIVSHRTGIVNALKQSVLRVEEQIAAHGKASEQTRAEMEEILGICAALEQELNGYQTELLQN